MPVSLSIKNVPEDVVERLRARAERNHRSMQGEMMAILEAALDTDAGVQGGAARAASDEGPPRAVGPDPRRGVATTDDALALMREEAATAAAAARTVEQNPPGQVGQAHESAQSTTQAEESSA